MDEMHLQYRGNERQPKTIALCEADSRTPGTREAD
jgi:hypothetical protein